jgi:phospholipid-binding lipoprotein MlaA
MRPQTIVKKPLLFGSLVISVIIGGCATTGTDPWKGWNKGAQSFNDRVDKAILKPLAKGYQWITPEVVDQSVTRVFSNVNDIGVTINDFLQLKPLQGGMDASRFLINTTVGIGGIIDVAEQLDLSKHHEDFGQTLAVWNVPSGPYLVLPFYGPSSPRDTLGLIGDTFLNPLTYVSIFGDTAANAATSGARAVSVIDMRAGLLGGEKVLNEAAGDDRYDFIKNAYQQRRNYLINDGVSKDDNGFDIDNADDDMDAADKASAPPKTGQPKTAPKP